MRDHAAIILETICWTTLALCVAAHFIWQPGPLAALFSNWAFVGGTLILECRIFRRGGDSLLWNRPGEWLKILLPTALFLALSFKILPNDWAILQRQSRIASVFFLPAMIAVQNALEVKNIFPRNDFAAFFQEAIPSRSFNFFLITAATLTALAWILKPVAFLFFPLAVFIALDAVNWKKSAPSFLGDLRQKNTHRFLQTLIAGTIVSLVAWPLSSAGFLSTALMSLTAIDLYALVKKLSER